MCCPLQSLKKWGLKFHKSFWSKYAWALSVSPSQSFSPVIFVPNLAVSVSVSPYLTSVSACFASVFVNCLWCCNLSSGIVLSLAVEMVVVIHIFSFIVCFRKNMWTRIRRISTCSQKCSPHLRWVSLQRCQPVALFKVHFCCSLSLLISTHQ